MPRRKQSLQQKKSRSRSQRKKYRNRSQRRVSSRVRRRYRSACDMFSCEKAASTGKALQSRVCTTLSLENKFVADIVLTYGWYDKIHIYGGQQSYDFRINFHKPLTHPLIDPKTENAHFSMGALGRFPDIMDETGTIFTKIKRTVTQPFVTTYPSYTVSIPPFPFNYMTMREQVTRSIVDMFDLYTTDCTWFGYGDDFDDLWKLLKNIECYFIETINKSNGETQLKQQMKKEFAFKGKPGNERGERTREEMERTEVTPAYHNTLKVGAIVFPTRIDRSGIVIFNKNRDEKTPDTAYYFPYASREDLNSDGPNRLETVPLNS